MKKRPSRKGTGQHIMSNADLKNLLVKQGILKDENVVRNVERGDSTNGRK